MTLTHVYNPLFQCVVNELPAVPGEIKIKNFCGEKQRICFVLYIHVYEHDLTGTIYQFTYYLFPVYIYIYTVIVKLL